MTAVIQLAALCLLCSALFNHKAIEHWVMNHKPYGIGAYGVICISSVAAVIWLLGSLG